VIFPVAFLPDLLSIFAFFFPDLSDPI
jgi:hypothetical protein